MFDFKKLDIPKKSKTFYIDCKYILSESKLDNYIKDQLSRAAFSVPLNIAEGSGKFSKKDRKNYFTTSSASPRLFPVAVFYLMNRLKFDLAESVFTNVNHVLYNHPRISNEQELDALIRVIAKMVLYTNFNKQVAKAQGWL